MSEILITHNDIVFVSTFNTQPGRYGRYIGKVVNIIMPGGIETNQQLCVIGEIMRNTKAKIKINPMFNLPPGVYYYDGSPLEPIPANTIQFENPMDIHIITFEEYDEIRIKLLTKLNILSNLLFGADELRIERLVNKPKPFKINKM